MRSIWINKKYIAKISFSITAGVIYAFLGYISTFVPIDEILSDKMSIWIRIFISTFIFIVIWFVLFVCISIVNAKERFEVFSVNNGHKLYLQYGDIFNANEVIKPNERRNIVIPVNRCFDTRVDNQIVSEKTLHGIAFKKLYTSGKYTEKTLDSLIKKLLVKIKYENLSKEEKPKGNRKRYPVGTVIDLPIDENHHYFLLALSTFDSKLNAHTSGQEYTLAVQKLIELCNSKSEGFPVVLPLLGTGLSRTKKNQKDILQYLISAFKINKDEINCDIHIVVYEDMKNEIEIMSIK